MHTAIIAEPDNLDEFRVQARRLLAVGAHPSSVLWLEQDASALFADAAPQVEATAFVPRAFILLAEAVACHCDAARWSLLYEALWRLMQGERALLDLTADALVHRLRRMETAVRRDAHRMTAFVRFRTITDEAGEHFMAWYEPQHRVLRRTSDFFIERFASMRFTIMTPDLTLHWDQVQAQFGPGLPKPSHDTPDGLEESWKRYYAATFNPARTNPALMSRHMPRHFWRNLPEAAAAPDLIAGAERRIRAMIK